MLITRVGSRTTATSKMEHFVIVVNGCKPLTITTKCSILDVAGVLDPPLITVLDLQRNYLGSAMHLDIDLTIRINQSYQEITQSLSKTIRTS